MTQIAVVAAGSRGDVQPYVALGKGLQAAGFAVRIVTSIDFERLVLDAGLDFCSTGESIEEMIQSDQWRQTLEGGNFLAIVNQMNREMTKRAKSVASVLPGQIADVDLMIAGLGGLMGAFSIAEKLDIPIIQAYLYPLTPTREFAGPLTPNLPLGKTLNPLSFQVTRQMLWQSGRVGDAATRRELNMPRGSLWGPFSLLRKRQIPVLYGYSRHVLPHPSDWDTTNHVTGYWFLDAHEDWMPPEDLLEFLNAGDPPVYVGFGSMGNRNPAEAAEITLQALQRAGQRGVLAAGWGGLSPADVPESVYMISSIPHSWLFPRMAAVVHHGGAGTTAAGLRAGIPSIVIPFMGDQPYWGQRVAALGVGPRPIPRRKLTVEALEAAIGQAIHDSQMRQRARKLGESIRNERGVDNAVAIIRKLVPRGTL